MNKARIWPQKFKVRLKPGADADEVRERTGASVWFADDWDSAKSINSFNVGTAIALALIDDPDVETDIDNDDLLVRDVLDTTVVIPEDPGDGAKT